MCPEHSIFYLCLQKYQIRNYFNLYVPSLFRHSLWSKKRKASCAIQAHSSICPSPSISNSHCLLDIHKMLQSSLQKSVKLEQVLCNSVSEGHTLLMGINESVHYINFFPDLVWAAEVQFQIERKRLEWLGCVLNVSSKSDLQIFRRQRKVGRPK